MLTEVHRDGMWNVSRFLAWSDRRASSCSMSWHLVSGTVSKLRRSGLVQLGCAMFWGLTLIGVGLSSSASLALGFLVLAGAADAVGVVTRGGLVQLVTPDGLRGRVSAVDHVIGVAGPEVGNMRGGVLAAAIGAPAALVIGGISAALAATAIGVTHPQLVAYATDTADTSASTHPRP